MECGSFPSFVLKLNFNDVCFPPKCNDRIKIKTPSSYIKLPDSRSEM